MITETPKQLFRESGINTVIDHIPPRDEIIELVSVTEDGIEVRGSEEKETTFVEWEVARSRYTPAMIYVPESKTVRDVLKPDRQPQ